MTKKEVIRIAKELWNCDFDIELLCAPSLLGGVRKRVILNNSLHFEMDIEYGSLEVKRRIYRFIVRMLKRFDFSTTIEIYSWEALLDAERVCLQKYYEEVINETTKQN